MTRGPKPIPIIDRVMQRVVVNEATGCWIWQGAVGYNGYGRVGEDGREFRTHRVTYKHFVGPIAEGLQMDHLCHTNDLDCQGRNECPHRRCCNPDHLEPVTVAENRRRAGARLTRCKRGHEFTPENTIRTEKQRACRKCSLARARKWKREHRSHVNAYKRAKYAAERVAA